MAPVYRAAASPLKQRAAEEEHAVKKERRCQAFSRPSFSPLVHPYSKIRGILEGLKGP